MQRGRGFTILILLFAVFIAFQNKMNLKVSQADEVTIPKDAVRLRIVANSNSEIDQQIKTEIRDEVITYLEPKLKDKANYQEAREVIYDSQDDLSQLVNDALEEHGFEDMNYSVDYGRTEFPKKVYGDTVYPAGTYDSIYIYLGEGEGDNWWCVLFPPLCLVDLAVDESGNVTKIDEEHEIEYSFLIIEKFKDWFGNN
ncbi:stage II sporulation protein R [Haloplasma contractile]|uniref:Stage II sporulation protein R n=1 Tax=Haloplasma contractile SSD-17B TaxID=1033810 RepID=U2EB58_9MOLU|nr:stage II sporulation protein R [Haloplasma contractile]ERJ12338.1 Putative stage II sporulation protein R [Haloplasma contractile SSD-17B]